MYVTYNGHSEVAKLFIEHGANVNARNNNGNMTLSIVKKRKSIPKSFNYLSKLEQKNNQTNR